MQKAFLMYYDYVSFDQSSQLLVSEEVFMHSSRNRKKVKTIQGTHPCLSGGQPGALVPGHDHTPLPPSGWIALRSSEIQPMYLMRHQCVFSWKFLGCHPYSCTGMHLPHHEQEFCKSSDIMCLCNTNTVFVIL